MAPASSMKDFITEYLLSMDSFRQYISERIIQEDPEPALIVRNISEISTNM